VLVVYGGLIVGDVAGVVGVVGAGVDELPTVTESFMPALQCPGMPQMK
jgi:hypothetical protein